jgi:UrcA family protein
MTLAAAALLTACVARPALEAVPHVRLAVADLAIDTPADRAVLRARVAAAARRFCAANGNEITPVESHTDPYYCTDMVRSDIMHGMTSDMRRAYELSRREAGVRGRNL